MLLRSSALLFIFACALPAQAGLFSDDEARRQLNDVRTQLESMQMQYVDATHRLESVTQHQVDFSNQIEALKADIAKLRGRIDELTYNLDSTQNRQRDFYVDLDNRLRKIESQAQSQQAEEEAKAESAKVADAEAMRDYDAALTALKGSDFKLAVSGFESFIKAAPDSPQQPGAHFFAAYCYSHLKQPAKAAELFNQLIEKWPDDEHAPDAMLGYADSLQDLGRHKEARTVMASLAAKYPASDAGKQAKARLQKK
ncbi:MAG: tol-pal system protein YbgF [Georgfuchsia sp.]